MTSVTNAVFRRPYSATFGGGTLSFEIAEPWYRSLPISCIAGLEVEVDGHPVPARRVSLEIDGVMRTLGECARNWQTFWFVQDPATVRVPVERIGERVRIRAQLSLRIPYIMVGPETALPRHVVEEQAFEVSRS